MNAQQYFTEQHYLNQAFEQGESASVYGLDVINPYQSRSKLADYWERGFEYGLDKITLDQCEMIEAEVGIFF